MNSALTDVERAIVAALVSAILKDIQVEAPGITQTGSATIS
jgi:hypothetical protein